MGIIFQPILFESLGGVMAEAERVLKCLSKAVVDNTDTPVTCGGALSGNGGYFSADSF